MFMIPVVAGLALGLFALATVLVASLAMKREDRTRTSVHRAPQGVPTALSRRAFGLHVINPSPARGGETRW